MNGKHLILIAVILVFAATLVGFDGGRQGWRDALDKALSAAADARAEALSAAAETRAKAVLEAAETDTEQDQGDGANPGEVVLEFEGDPETKFSGSCVVGGEEQTFSGQVPERLSFEADGERVSCEIRKEDSEGSLKVIFTAGDNVRSVQQISGQGSTTKIVYGDGSLSTSTSSGGGVSFSRQVSVSSSSSQQVVSSSSSQQVSSQQVISSSVSSSTSSR